MKNINRLTLFFLMSLLITSSCNKNNKAQISDTRTVISWHDSISNIPSQVFLHSQNKENFSNGTYLRYNKDGIIKSVTPIKNGVKHGEVKSYYSDGQLYFIINYKNNIKNGFAKTYSKEGGVISEGHYYQDEKRGEWTYYDKEGCIKEVQEYN